MNVASGKELVFLLDTGVEISILKENSDNFQNIQDNHIINIQGISQKVTKSKGLIQTSKYIIPHDFHIVNMQFAIPCDGILGIDFSKRYNCQLDFKPSEDWLIIRPNKNRERVVIDVISGWNGYRTFRITNDVAFVKV